MCDTLEEVIENLKNKSTGKYIHGAPWSDKDFERLLSETGCRVPRQLEQTLKTYGALDPWQEQYFLSHWPDGTVKKHQTQISVGDVDSMIDEFQSFRVNPAWNEDRFPYDMVFFGTADGGHTVLLASGTDQSDNTVYLWEKAGDPWGVGDNAIGIAKVADTFFEFLCGLTDEENL